MKEDKIDLENAINLRRRAEAMLEKRSTDLDELSTEDARHLVHELRTHQIELEMQNEELRRTEQELETSRDRYFRLYDLAPVGYLTVNKHGLIVQANLTSAALLGKERGSLVGTPLSRYFTSDGQDAFYLHLRRAFQTDVLCTCELKMVRADGSLLHAQVQSVVIRDGQGDDQCQTVLTDVTPRVQAEEALRFQANALDQVQDAVVAVDNEQRVVYLNQCAAEQYDLDLQDSLGRRLTELYRYEFLDPGDEEAAFAAMARDGSWRGETVHIKRNGERLFVESSVSLLQDAAGQNAGMLAVIRDVSERKRQQQERERLLAQSIRDRKTMEELVQILEQERAVLDAIIEHTHTQLVYLDPQFNIVWANAACGRGPGYSAQDLLGRNHFELFPHPENQAIFERVRDTRQAMAFHANPIAFPDRPELGTTYWDWTLVPVLGAGGNVEGLVLSLLNVTARERSRLEREAQGARQGLLVEVSKQILQENTVQGVLQHAVDAACKLSGARLAISGFLSPDGRFQIGPTHCAEGAPPCLLAQTFTIERGGVYLDLIQGRSSMRLTDEEMRQHPGWWGLPDGHVRLRGFLGARLVGHDGRTVGMMMLSDKTEGDFTAEDEASLVQLASLVSLALQRLKAHEEAERRADELNAAFDAMLDGLIVYDADGMVTRANRVASTTTESDPVGVHRTELIQTFATRTVDGRLVVLDDLPSTRALRGETVTGDRLVIRSAQGNDLTVLASATPLRKGGAISGAVLLWHDITELEQMQMALRRSANRLQLLHEADRALLASQTAQEIAVSVLPYLRQLVPCTWATVTAFDRQADRVLFLAAMTEDGIGPQRGARGPLEEAWFVSQLCPGQVYVEETLEGLASSSLFEDLRCRGGHSFVSVPLVFQDQVVGSLNLGTTHPGPLEPEQVDILLEIADQLTIGIRQAELHDQVQRHADKLEQIVARRTAALQTSQARLQAIYDRAPLGIVLVDGDGRLIECNPAFREIVGYNLEELRGKPLGEFTHPDDLETGPDPIEQFVADRRDRYHLEKRYIHKDGRAVWVALSATAIRADAGYPRLALQIVEDITDKREAQQALIQAEKLSITGQLAASLAHEINNPLQAVIGCLDLAEGALAAGEDPGRYLAVAQRELGRAARVVGHLRDLHRRSGSEQRELVDVNALVQSVLEVIAGQCKRRGVEVEWRGTDDMPPISALPDQLQQLFLNLILNAMEAMPDGGRLQVSTMRTDEPDGIDVRFADTGVGIAADDRSHLYEPFYTTRPEGMGLGLYVSRNIVEHHRGRIEVESTVGQGTTFTVWLPR